LGGRGCHCFDIRTSQGKIIEGYPAKAFNTVGAGDAHFGTVMANLHDGKNLEEACCLANKAGSVVIIE
jgi:sugar/nucleoside kinase (ribokinase family)